MTDFILSVEIVIIALGTVSDSNISFPVQIVTVAVVAFLATVGVYGIVALIVRMDDAGYLILKKQNKSKFLQILGISLVKALPYVIRILAFVGTIALLLVSGGIFVHNIDFLHHFLPNIPSTIKEFGIGIVAGLLVFVVVVLMTKVIALFKKK